VGKCALLRIIGFSRIRLWFVLVGDAKAGVFHRREEIMAGSTGFRAKMRHYWATGSLDSRITLW
jgi:hypothetical protein